MTNHMNRWIKNARKILIALYGGSCKQCGKTEKLEFAHIKETPLQGKSGRGRKERYYDIINNRDAYVLLCHDCHTRLDASTNQKQSWKGR